MKEEDLSRAAKRPLIDYAIFRRFTHRARPLGPLLSITDPSYDVDEEAMAAPGSIATDHPIERPWEFASSVR